MKNARLETSLVQLNEAYERLRRQEQALEADLAQAQRMQRFLLPAGFPRLNDIEFRGYYRPCQRQGDP